jgi:hypothetical protein
MAGQVAIATGKASVQMLGYGFMVDSSALADSVMPVDQVARL